MQVVGQRVHVVEELAVHHPATVLVDGVLAQELDRAVVHRVAQRDLAVVIDVDVAQALVPGGAGAIIGCRGGREPALVDAAALAAQGIQVVRVQAQPPPRYTKRAGHPGRRQPHDAAALLQRLLNQLLI